MEVKKQWKTFGGSLKQCVHESKSTGTSMRFSIYTPAAASSEAKVPLIYYLSGLTCTDENFVQKAGSFQHAAKHGLAIIAPDTSPRGANVPGEDESWDIGTGAGFYVNAVAEPWATNYRMYDYIVAELPKLIETDFPEVDSKNASIMGHSMGGHGALSLAMKNPSMYRSVSAFAPICHPTKSQIASKCMTSYFGDNEEAAKDADSVELMKSRGPFPFEVLIDQGDADEFYVDGSLNLEAFQSACQEKCQKLTLNFQPGYDHSYFFISSFIGDHVEFHARFLKT